MEGKPDWLPDFPVQIYCNRGERAFEAENSRKVPKSTCNRPISIKPRFKVINIGLFSCVFTSD